MVFDKVFPKTRKKISQSNRMKSYKRFKGTVIEPATKSAFALTATGLAYATTYSAAKGLVNAASPETAERVDSYIRYTDPGLAIQTAMMLGSTGLAIKFLDSGVGKTVVPNFFSQHKPEKKIMYSAVAGLAVGRLMTGLAAGGTGQRFQALFDANLPAAMYRVPGPYLNRPSNIKELDTVIARPTNNSAPVISSDYYSMIYQPKIERQLSLVNRSFEGNQAAANAAAAAAANAAPGGPTIFNRVRESNFLSRLKQGFAPNNGNNGNNGMMPGNSNP
jgi:hypothetical protein